MILKKRRLYGPHAQGYKAFRYNVPRHQNPFCFEHQKAMNRAWNQGWYAASDKQQEKDDEM